MEEACTSVSFKFSKVIVLTISLLFAFTLPDAVLAGSSIKATSSFKAPKGCKADRKLAAQFNAVQACIERFTATHEFILLLQEKRYRSDANSVKRIAKKYISDLRKANAQTAGQSLELFKSFDYKPSAELPDGANFCSSANAVVIDRRVPGHVGEEFRNWIQTTVCTRYDPNTKTVQLVELRASERFRVATAGSLVLDRFKYLTPLGTHQKAMDTLRLY